MSLADNPTHIAGATALGGEILPPGSNFGQYKILGLLGRGGMGEVYRVRHNVLATDFAIKLINSDIAAQPGIRQRFMNEAKTMANLKHPGIVQVDDFGETDGRTWLRMDLAGASLADYLKEHGDKLPETEAAAIVLQILEALAYAHAQGVVHRDLKPANILWSDSSDPSDTLTIKIADFGLVSLAGDQWLQTQVQQTVARSMAIGGNNTVVASATGVGSAEKALLGTYAYMSPEQKEGKPCDCRSDLYSVGLMAFQMLTGEKTLGFELPSEINPSLSPAWDVWLRRALSSNPDRRFASASEMIKAMPYATTTRTAAKVHTPSPPHPPTVEGPSSHEEAWWLDENHKEAPSQTANIHSAGTAAQLGTKWLKFWSYFILPAFGVMHFSLGHSSPDAAIILILLGMLKFGVAFGLHRRRLWAWKWNRLMIFIYCAIWLVISVAGIIETAPSNQDNGTLMISISSAILVILLILWANQTYWKKRKSLFSW